MADSTLTTLQQQMRDFARERDWDQFQTPKNLVMALMVEAAELQEIFQWLTPEQSTQLNDKQRRKWKRRWPTCCSIFAVSLI